MFKKGDIVEITESRSIGSYLKKGSIVRVIGIENQDEYVQVSVPSATAKDPSTQYILTQHLKKIPTLFPKHFKGFKHT